MKKRMMVLLLSLIAVVTLCFGLTACGFLNGGSHSGETPDGKPNDWDDNPGYTHVHNFIERADFQYLCKEATCSSPAKYYYSCSECYEKSSNTFLYGEKGAHVFLSPSCEVCGHTLSESQGLEYELSDDGLYYSVVDIGSCTDKDILVPKFYKGIPVTEVADFAFYRNEKAEEITSVILQDGITHVGYSVFSNNYQLSNIVFPNSLQEMLSYLGELNGHIRYNQYDNAVYLGNKTNPFLVLVRGAYDYEIGLDYGYGIENCNVHQDTKFILAWAFSAERSFAYDNFSSVTIPEGVISIGAEAFGGTKLSEIILPNSLTTIGGNAFRNCTNLTSLIIPDSVTNIGGGAFWGCNSLRKLILSENLEYYGDCMINYPDEEFGEEPILSQINYNEYNGGFYLPSNSNPYFMLCYTVPNNDTTFLMHEQTRIIYDKAFSNCTNLQTIEVQNNVRYIGSYAFAECPLVSIKIPTTLQTTGNYIFGNSMDRAILLRNVYLNDLNALLEVALLRDTVVQHNDDFRVYLNGSILENVVIPDGTIVVRGFGGLKTIKSVTIPDSVTKICDGAFSECTNLETVVFGQNLKYISGFEHTALKNIILPDSVIELGYDAFAGCSFETFYMSSNIKIIGESAFNGCQIKSVTLPNSVLEIRDYAFNGSTIEQITFDTQIEKIGNYAFHACYNLKSVSIPDSTIELGEHTFSDCWNLETITIGKGLSVIGEGCFYFLNSLKMFIVDENNSDFKSVDDNLYSKDGTIFYTYCHGKTDTSYTIRNGVETIREYAFYDIDILESIILPDSLETISEFAFDSCDGIISLTIPDSVKGICDCAFSDCNGLSEIQLGEGILEIGERAFEGCKITTITLPNSVTKLGDGAFAYCENLSTIHFGNGLKEIGERAFVNTAIINLIIPDCVETVCDYAFSRCEDLETIQVGKGISYIGEKAFDECYKLSQIEVTASNSVYKSRNGVLYSYDVEYAWIHTVPYKVSGEITIDVNTLAIDSEDFENRNLITKINLGDKLARLEGENPFGTCANLASITINSRNEKYFTQSGILYDKQNMTFICIPAKLMGEILLPRSITELPNEAFKNRAITSIYLPPDITAIGSLAFSGCSALKKVVVDDINAFCRIDFGTEANPMVYADNLYIGENIVGGDIVIANDVQTVPSRTFVNSNITSISIPESVSEIGSWAFMNCQNLLSITVSAENEVYQSINGHLYDKEGTHLITVALNGIVDNFEVPQSVTYIYAYAFYKCNKIVSVSMNNVSYIGNYAFYECINLTAITNCSEVDTINGYAFYGCEKLARTAKLDNLRIISEYAFYDCGFESIEFGDKLETIGERCFQYSALKTITLPSSLQSIGKYAFSSTNLESATFEKTTGWHRSGMSIEQSKINTQEKAALFLKEELWSALQNY